MPEKLVFGTGKRRALPPGRRCLDGWTLVVDKTFDRFLILKNRYNSNTGGGQGARVPTRLQ